MTNEELITGLRHIAHTMERNGHSYYQHVAEDAIKALEQQPCEDAVSRTLVHEAITASIAESENPYEMWQRIEALPSVIPQRKRGKWVEVDGECQCNNCERFFPLDAKRLWVTCPRCNSYNGGGEDG